MINNYSKEDLMDLMKNSRTKEVLDILDDFLYKKDDHLHGEVLLLNARINRTKKEINKGLLLPVELDIVIGHTNSMIIDSLLEETLQVAKKLGEKRIKVVVGLLKYKESFLITKRAASEGDFTWGFPAGMVKPSLSEEATLIKEFKQETNIEVKPLIRLGERIHPNTSVKICYWYCEYISGEAENLDTDELDEIRWATGTTVLDLITSDIYPSILKILTSSLNMKRISVGIVTHQNKVLLVRRKKKEGKLQWQFPSGGIETEEKSYDAAKREVFEETGVICEHERKLGERTHPNTNVEIHYWACNFVEGKAYVKDSEELDEIMWCPKNEIENYITSDIFTPIKQYLELK